MSSSSDGYVTLWVHPGGGIGLNSPTVKETYTSMGLQDCKTKSDPGIEHHANVCVQGKRWEELKSKGLVKEIDFERCETAIENKTLSESILRSTRIL